MGTGFDSQPGCLTRVLGRWWLVSTVQAAQFTESHRVDWRLRRAPLEGLHGWSAHPDVLFRVKQPRQALGGLGWQTPLVSEEPDVLVVHDSLGSIVDDRRVNHQDHGSGSV